MLIAHFMGGKENPDKIFVDNLVRLTGLSATQIALQSGIAASTLTRMQSGRTSNRLRVSTLDRISQEFPAEFEAARQGFVPPPSVSTNQPRYSVPEASLPLDVPLYGRPAAHGLGRISIFDKGKFVKTIQREGEPGLEAFKLDLINPIGVVRRPPYLQGRTDVFAIALPVSSMWPRFKAGEVLYIDPRGVPGKMEDVLLAYRDEDTVGGAWLVMASVRSQGLLGMVLEQYSPPAEFQIANAPEELVGCVIPTHTLLSQ